MNTVSVAVEDTEPKTVRVGWYEDSYHITGENGERSGYEAARRIRALKNPELACIPIVAMTANAFEENKEKSYEAGMNGHLAKPMSVETLMNTLKNIMK